jgi:hypothetical protein
MRVASACRRDRVGAERRNRCFESASARSAARSTPSKPRRDPDPGRHRSRRPRSWGCPLDLNAKTRSPGSLRCARRLPPISRFARSGGASGAERLTRSRTAPIPPNVRDSIIWIDTSGGCGSIRAEGRTAKPPRPPREFFDAPSDARQFAVRRPRLRLWAAGGPTPLASLGPGPRRRVALAQNRGAPRRVSRSASCGAGGALARLAPAVFSPAPPL